MEGVSFKSFESKSVEKGEEEEERAIRFCLWILKATFPFLGSLVPKKKVEAS